MTSPHPRPKLRGVSRNRPAKPRLRISCESRSVWHGTEFRVDRLTVADFLNAIRRTAGSQIGVHLIEALPRARRSVAGRPKKRLYGCGMAGEIWQRAVGSPILLQNATENFQKWFRRLTRRCCADSNARDRLPPPGRGDCWRRLDGALACALCATSGRTSACHCRSRFQSSAKRSDDCWGKAVPKPGRGGGYFRSTLGARMFPSRYSLGTM